jgi:hypothetical protein
LLALAVAVVAAGAAGTVAILGATTALAASSGPIVGFGGKCASYKVGAGVTGHQAWGLGVYCYFSTNPAVVADRAIEVPTSGTTLRDMVTVSLGGTGTINHVVNGSGGRVSSSATVTYLVNYP